MATASRGILLTLYFVCLTNVTKIDIGVNSRFIYSAESPSASTQSINQNLFSAAYKIWTAVLNNAKIHNRKTK